jgi:hypothetical protein
MGNPNAEPDKRMICSQCGKVCTYKIQEQADEKLTESPEDKMMAGGDMKNK